MTSHILTAIRSMPWAILPGWLSVIESMALRMMDRPEVLAAAQDGHAARHAAAIAQMGQRLDGTRSMTLRDGVAALPIMGPIFPRANLMTDFSGACSLDMAAADLRAAFANDAVSNVLLVMDTPGGAVSGVAEFAGLLASAPKPVIAHASGMCCSAGYWIGSQASELVIDSTGLVGSIGVMISTSVQETPDSSGCRSIDIVSTGAPNKRPDMAAEEGQALVRANLDAIESIFVAAVACGRNVSAATVLAEFGQGGTMVGQQAVTAGMADRVDTLSGTLSRLSRGGKPRGGSRALAEHDLDLRRRSL
jgi:ClpP class serine protease